MKFIIILLLAINAFLFSFWNGWISPWDSREPERLKRQVDAERIAVLNGPQAGKSGSEPAAKPAAKKAAAKPAAKKVAVKAAPKKAAPRKAAAKVNAAAPATTAA